MSNISYSWQNTKLQCQIHGKIGHFAIKCWHRYDTDHQSLVPVNTSQFSNADDGDSTPSILRTPSTIQDPL